MLHISYPLLDVESEIFANHQLISSRRQLINVLTDEIRYLTMSNDGYMTEFVHLDRIEKQFLRNVQELLNTYDLTLG